MSHVRREFMSMYAGESCHMCVGPLCHAYVGDSCHKYGRRGDVRVCVCVCMSVCALCMRKSLHTLL